MQSLVIEKVYVNTERKDGTKYVSKNGKPYKMITIYADNEKYTLWDTEANYGDKAYAIGDTVTGEVTTKDGFKSITVEHEKKVDAGTKKLLEGYDQQIKLIWEAIDEMSGKLSALEMLSTIKPEDTDNTVDIPWEN